MGVTFSRILFYLSKDRCRVYFWLEVHAISYRRQALIKIGGRQWARCIVRAQRRRGGGSGGAGSGEAPRGRPNEHRQETAEAKEQRREPHPAGKGAKKKKAMGAPLC